MNNKKLQALYALKWNPFSPEIPTEALWTSPRLDLFAPPAAPPVRDHGGFALISGEPGTGESTALRLTAHRLAELPDVIVGALSRPQSRLADFYRRPRSPLRRPSRSPQPLGGLPGVSARSGSLTSTRPSTGPPSSSTRRGSAPSVLSELRLLASADFDSRSLLTVVLCGDSRLLAMLKTEDLLPVASRIRARLLLEPTPQRTPRLSQTLPRPCR